MDKLRRGAAGLLLAGLALTGARADELVLRDGRTLEGDIAADGEEYVLRAGKAATRIPKHEVREIIRKPTKEQRYANLLAVTPEKDAAEQLALAKWCRQNGMPGHAKEHFAKVLELEPDNAEARRALGFTLYKGEWKTREEAYRAQGKELYKGEWLPAAEAEKRAVADAKKAVLEKNRAEFFALIKQAGTRGRGEGRQELVRQLAELQGDNTDSLLHLYATDDSAAVRDAVYQAIAARGHAGGLAVLVRHLRTEDSPRLLKTLNRLLLEWEPRDDVRDKLMGVALQAPGKSTRMRAWPLLREIADKSIFPGLIADVDFCPLPENEIKRPGGGAYTTTSENVRREPYYPAHELLTYLTNQKFAHDQKEAWEKWWAENAETFDFARPPAPAEVPPAVEKKPEPRPASDERKKNEQKQTPAGK